MHAHDASRMICLPTCWSRSHTWPNFLPFFFLPLFLFTSEWRRQGNACRGGADAGKRKTRRVASARQRRYPAAPHTYSNPLKKHKKKTSSREKKIHPQQLHRCCCCWRCCCIQAETSSLRSTLPTTCSRSWKAPVSASQRPQQRQQQLQDSQRRRQRQRRRTDDCLAHAARAHGAAHCGGSFYP